MQITLSQRVRSLAESATLAVSAKAAKLKSEGVDIISFGAGEPDFTTPPHIIEAAKAALDAGETKYPKPASGLATLKQAIQGKLRRENNLEYETKQIVVTVGGKDGCYLALHALIDPGHEVIIPAPYWVSYPEMVKLAGGTPVFIQGDPTNDFRVTPDQIRSAITTKTRAIFLNYPSNPGGHMYSPDQVRDIAAVLAGTDVVVLADEIYDRLVYDGHEHLSFAAVSQDAYDRTITLNSASKTYAMTGWRLGFAAGNRDVIKGIAKLITQDTSGAATFSQHAYAAALSGDQGCVDTMRTEFTKRRAIMCDGLNAIDGVHCRPPGGAFYTFPDVGDTYRSLGVSGSVDFAGKLLEKAGVAVVPGAAFGMDRHVRLSFATSTEQIVAGLQRLADFVRSA
jgi:aspartate aminotransferase